MEDIQQAIRDWFVGLRVATRDEIQEVFSVDAAMTELVQVSGQLTQIDSLTIAQRLERLSIAVDAYASAYLNMNAESPDQYKEQVKQMAAQLNSEIQEIIKILLCPCCL